MNWLEKRMVWTVFKFAVYAMIIWYLWTVGFFVFLFVWLPWLITYTYGLIIEFGLMRVLSYYHVMWTIIAIMLVILAILVFEIIYRAKRKDFQIGGDFEGRVIWVKGLREGLIYSVWDLYNYTMWKLGKKKDVDMAYWNSPNVTGRYRGIRAKWPNPFAISIGVDVKYKYVFYVRRRFFLFQIIPEKWYIPVGTTIGKTYNSYTLPDAKFVRIPDPKTPGRYLFHVVDKMPDTVTVTPKKLTMANRIQLSRAGKMVDKAILVDAETKKRDFTHGSFSIPQMAEPDGAYDE